MAKTSTHIGNMRTYTVVFEPAEEGGYVVRIPYLNIATQGETLEEGRAMAIDAIAGYLTCLAEEGRPIPEEPVSIKGKIFVEHIDITL